MVGSQVFGDCDLPLVTISKQLLLIVEQLLVCLSGELVVGSFNNCINGARLLAKTAVDAFCHIDVISGGSATAIRTLL